VITPIQGRVLVELKGEYENIEASEDRFGSPKTRGRVLAVADDVDSSTGIEVGKMVYFGKYEDSASLKLPSGKPGALIKLEEIGAVE
jgi:hypothetical protein